MKKINSKTKILTIMAVIGLWHTTLHASSLREACKETLENHSFEKKISQEFLYHKNLFNSFRVNIDDLTKYRATRLINDKLWTSKNSTEMALPWEIYTPIPGVWLNWEKGASYVNNNFKYIVENLDEKIIKEIYTQSMDKSIMSIRARIKAEAIFGDGTFGTIRSGETTAPAWTAKCDESPLSTDEVKTLLNFNIKVNNYFGSEPLLDIVLSKKQQKNYDKLVKRRYLSPEQKNAIKLQVTECKKKRGYHQVRVEYLESQQTQNAIKQFLGYYHTTLRDICHGRNKMSPVDFASKIQRWFIAIHPFSDGNGRTSRFIQDALMKYFDLPYLNTGKLQDDLTSEENKYAQLSKSIMQEQIAYFQECRKEYTNYKNNRHFSIKNNCLPSLSGDYDNNLNRVQAKQNFSLLLDEFMRR